MLVEFRVRCHAVNGMSKSVYRKSIVSGYGFVMKHDNEESLASCTARKRYGSDLTDGQWSTIASVVPAAKQGKTGRPPKYARREIWNAIFYQARTGCSWRDLPHDLPPWNNVWEHFWRWRNDGTIEVVHDALRGQVRVQEGHEPTPSAAIIDSQSVKTAQKGGSGPKRSKTAGTMPPSASRDASDTSR